MSEMIDRLPLYENRVVTGKKASLFTVLQQALRRQRVPQQLPAHLYADLGIPPSMRPDFTPRGR